MSHPRAPSLIRSTPCRSIPHPPRRCRQCIGEERRGEESMERGIWFDHSCHPPTLPPIDGAVPPPDWTLLDILAYFDGRRNDTTADALTRASDRIQVTFWAAPPPHVSYVGVHCPGLEPSRFGTEPEIMTTDEDLALLRIAICPEHGLSRQSSYDYFVYRARGSEREKPALLRLPNPTDERRFSAHQVGLLRCRNDDNGRFRFLVAALASTGVNGRYSLYLFDSSTWEWKSKQVYLSSPQEGHYNIHLTSKVESPNIFVPSHPPGANGMMLKLMGAELDQRLQETERSKHNQWQVKQKQIAAATLFTLFQGVRSKGVLIDVS